MIPSRSSPIRWERKGLTHDGIAFRIRPICADDAARERRFVQSLSPDARYARLMYTVSEPPEAWVARWVDVDYALTMAFVALMGSGADERIIGVARYAGTEVGDCEFAAAVLDEWQRRGVASLLSKYLFVYARRHGVQRLTATMFANNLAMIELAKKLGMSPHCTPAEPTLMTASRSLSRPRIHPHA
jgi:RimJ/RimL family protein N-acetyltransferase